MLPTSADCPRFKTSSGEWAAEMKGDLTGNLTHLLCTSIKVILIYFLEAPLTLHLLLIPCKTDCEGNGGNRNKTICSYKVYQAKKFS